MFILRLKFYKHYGLLPLTPLLLNLPIISSSNVVYVNTAQVRMCHETKMNC